MANNRDVQGRWEKRERDGKDGTIRVAARDKGGKEEMQEREENPHEKRMTEDV